MRVYAMAVEQSAVCGLQGLPKFLCPQVQKTATPALKLAQKN
jgi:hypothetical protein